MATNNGKHCTNNDASIANMKNTVLKHLLNLSHPAIIVFLSPPPPPQNPPPPLPQPPPPKTSLFNNTLMKIRNEEQNKLSMSFYVGSREICDRKEVETLAEKKTVENAASAIAGFQQPSIKMIQNYTKFLRLNRLFRSVDDQKIYTE